MRHCACARTSSPPTVAAYNAAKKLQLPFVLSPHGGLQWLGKRTAKYVFENWLGTMDFRRCSQTHRRFALSKNKTHGFRCEPRTDSRFTEYHLSRRLLQSTQGGRPLGAVKIREDKIVLFLGRLHWIKGADLLSTPYPVPTSVDGNDHLVIAGPDDGQERELRRKVEDFKSEAPNYICRVSRSYARSCEAFVDASVVVIPSRSEVFAITALESLLCCRPVVLSSACGLFPMPGSECGVVQFKSEDLADLIKTLQAALSGSGSSAAKGREFVIREFSPETVGKRAEVIYEEAIRGR